MSVPCSSSRVAARASAALTTAATTAMAASARPSFPRSRCFVGVRRATKSQKPDESGDAAMKWRHRSSFWEAKNEKQPTIDAARALSAASQTKTAKAVGLRFLSATHKLTIITNQLAAVATPRSAGGAWSASGMVLGACRRHTSLWKGCLAGTAHGRSAWQRFFFFCRQASSGVIGARGEGCYLAVGLDCYDSVRVRLKSASRCVAARRESRLASSGTQAHTSDTPAPYAITAAAAGRTSERCGGSPTG